MKIVVNRCFGGFGLSVDAFENIQERKGNKLYDYKWDDIYGPFGDRVYTKIKKPKTDKEWYVTATKDLGSITSEEQISEYRVSDYDFIDNRTDLDMISVIEEIGAKRSSGYLSKLQVVEIPDDIEYDIDEYDGKEWVVEKHRRW